jgi:RHS repeat-associated protein
MRRWIAAALILFAGRAALAGTAWSESTHQLAFADFNGDGRSDVLYIAREHTLPSGIAVSDGNSPSISLQSWPSNYLGIPWHGDVYKAFVADYNGDSRADILLQRQSPGDHYLLLANGAGQFTAIGQAIPDVLDQHAWSADSHGIVVGDFDGNGRADVLLQSVKRTGLNAVFLSNESGMFTVARQAWGNTHMGFRWSSQDAVITAGKFNGDSKSDLLIQAKPGLVMMDSDVPVPMPVHRAGSFGIVGAKEESAAHEIFYSPALQIWDRHFQNADWSAANYDAVVGDFDGVNRDDIFLQARRSGQPNRLFSIGSHGQVSGPNVLPAGSLVANTAADQQRFHAARFGASGAVGLYLQPVHEGGASQVLANVISGLPVVHDPSLLNVMTPGTAVGAIPGEFSVDPSGASNYRIAVGVPPGVAGLTPELALVYSSRGGNGLLGVGWELSGLSAITRCPTTTAQDGVGNADGVDLDGNDAFCLDGQRLMAVSGTNGSVGAEYRTEVESHQKVTSTGATAGDPDSFTVWDKPGLIREYGTQSSLSGSKLSAGDSRFEARLANGSPGPALVWSVKVIRDRFDNFIEYRYEQESASHASWPVEITYGSKYHGAKSVVGRVLFSYSTRADSRTGFMAGGYLTSLGRRLQKISVFGRTNPTVPGANDLVRQYYLDYEYSSITKLSHLIAATLCDGGAGALQRCFKSTRFQWQYGNRGFSNASVASNVDFGSTVDLKMLDADGDGRTDYVYRHASGQNTGQWLVRYASLVHSKGSGSYVATGIDRKQSDRAFAIDWNNDGYADLVDSTETVGGSTGFAGAYRVLLGGPGGFSSGGVATFPSLPAEALTFKGLATSVGDFDGDGRQDVAYSPSFVADSAVFSGSLKIRLNNAGNAQSGLEAGSTVNATIGNVGPAPYVPPPALPWRFDKSAPVAWDYEPNGFKDEPALYAINFDGDGRDDLLVRVTACYTRPSLNGSGTACIPEFHVYSLTDGTLQRVWGLQLASGSISHLKTGDFNGDGLTDMLSWGQGFDPQATTAGWHLDLGTGSRGTNGVPAFKSVMAATATSIQSECSDIDFNFFRLVFGPSYTGSNCTEPASVPLTEPMLDSALPFDYNRDGYTDLVLARDGNWQVLPGGPAGYVNSFLNTGRPARQSRYATLIDDGADGLPDILFPWSDAPESNWHVYYGRGPAVQGVIERITDGYGAETTVQYLPLTATTNHSSYIGTVYKGHTRFPEDAASATESGFRTEVALGWPTAHAAGPIPVVHQYAADNGLGSPGSERSTIRTSYEYWGLKINREGRGSLGFSQVRSWNDNSEIETRNRFAQRSFPNSGMLLTAEQRARDQASVNTSLAGAFNPAALLLRYHAACEMNPACAQLNPVPSGYDENAGYKRFSFTTNVLSATLNTYGNGARTLFPYVRKSVSDSYPVSAGSVGDQPYKRVVSEYLQSATSTADAELAAGTPAYDAFGNPGSVRITVSNASTGGTAVTRDEHITLTTNTFANDVGNWCLARLGSTTVTHSKPPTNATGNAHAPTTVSRNSSFTYQAGSQCVLLSETTEPAAVGQLSMTKTYAYDPFGNRYRETVGGYNVGVQEERTSGSMFSDGSSSFTTTQGQLPAEVRNAAGHAQATQWDGRFGLAILTTDANGVASSTVYDSFGRERRVTPMIGLPTAYGEHSLYWCANTGMCWDTRSVFALRKYSSDGKESWVEHDRLGRAIATRERGFDGQWIAAEKYFDPLGREYLASRPYQPAVHPTRCWEWKKFDVLNRETLAWTSYSSAECTATVPGFSDSPSSIGPGKQTEVVYDLVPTPGVAGSQGSNGIAQRITGNSTDGSGYATTRVSYKLVNVMDRTRFVQDSLAAAGCPGNGVPIPANTASCLQTEYDHDAQGNLTLTRQVGALGGGTNATSRTLDIRSQFNLRGFRTQTHDPDMGIWRYAYNAFGELVTQTDARGQVTQMQYDRLGRMISRTEKLADGTTELTSSWRFDTATKGVGKLASVVGSDGYAEWYTYDTLGRESRIRRSIAGSFYYVDQSYDALGRPETVKYPGSVDGDSSSGPEVDANRLRVRNNYNAFGFLESVQDVAAGTVYWRGDGADENGSITRETLGNARVTRRYFDRSSGHLVSLKTGSSSNESETQHLEFAFDQAANLRMRKDRSPDVNGVGGIREEYGYDSLFRLTQMRQYKPSEPGTASPTLTQNYSYDGFGNLLSKGGGFSTYCYNTQSPGADPCAGVSNALPHAAKRVVVNGLARDYAFNENGHVVSATNSMYDTVTWFVSNNARRVSKGGKFTEFWYAPSRTRYRQHLHRASGDTQTTIYVGGLYEKLSRIQGSATTVEHTHYVRAGSTVIALAKRQRAGSGPAGAFELRYLHRDQLGSVVALTDAVGRLLERSGFDPWGKRTSYQTWSPVNPGQYTLGGTGAAGETGGMSSTKRGYTGHEHVDELGFVHMNGRIYDSELGRFFSPDPTTQFPESTQGFNRYAYAGNNPLTNVDPSGFSFAKVIGVLGQILQFIPATFWLGMLLNAISGFLQGGLAGGLLSVVSSAASCSGLLNGGFWSRLGVSAAQALLTNTILGAANGYQTSLGQAFRGALKSLPGQVALMCVTMKVTEVIRDTVTEARAAGTRTRKYLVSVEELATQNASGTDSAVETTSVSPKAYADTTDGFHITRGHFHSIEALRKAVGWVEGEQTVFFGKRPLKYPGFKVPKSAFPSDLTNTELLHEEVFWFDAEGRLESLGYGPEGIRSDLDGGHSIKEFTFTRGMLEIDATVDIKHLLRNLPPSVRTTRAGLMASDWKGNSYDLISHNCQDFASASYNALKKFAR